MKKPVFLFLFVFLTIITLSANNSFSDIYKQNYKGVVLIQEGAFIDSSKIKHTDLFRKMEKTLSIKILDEYLCFPRGSGFIISEDGHIITNNHVLTYINVKDKQNLIFWKFINDIVNQLPPGYLTTDELRSLTVTLRSYLKKAEFNFIVKYYDESLSVPDVLFADSDMDIALLKAKSQKNLPVFTLGSSSDISSGDEIAAIGFPLQNIIETFLSEFKSTFTTGVISANRDERWGIQHTASINPGNSGGPLLNIDGYVIGINVGLVKGSNNIYFAIPVDKCRTLLAEKGFTSVISGATKQ